MSYALESIDDGHIILFTMHEDFDINVDMPEYLEACYELVENGPEQIVIITDARALVTTGLEQVIQGANSVRSEAARRISKHPKIIKNFSVITSRIGQLAVKGLNTAAFGFFEVGIFETPEEAMSRARELISV